MAVDLFGDPIPETPPKPKRDKPKGFAAPPGSGPEGKTCADCLHFRRTRSGSRKTFFKCALIKPTRGAGTDIRARSPACSRFKDSSIDLEEYIREGAG